MRNFSRQNILNNYVRRAKTSEDRQYIDDIRLQFTDPDGVMYPEKIDKALGLRFGKVAPQTPEQQSGLNKNLKPYKNNALGI